MDILGTLQKLSMESGFAAFFVTDGGWKNLIMIIIAFVLLYLGIVKKFEPLLLCGIAFGCLLTNLSYFIGMGENALYHPELWEAFLDEASPYYHSYGHVMSNAGLLDFFYIGVKAGIYPSLIFLGVGAMTDFGPLLANPKSLLLGASASARRFRRIPRRYRSGLHRSRGRFHRHHRRRRRPDRNILNNKACASSVRTYRHCGVFLHGSDPAHSAASYEALHNKGNARGENGAGA